MVGGDGFSDDDDDETEDAILDFVIVEDVAVLNGAPVLLCIDTLCAIEFPKE